jgi:glycosyltransferase involved in cell wall biosynthesis
MRISLVADARSPIAQSWFDAVVACGYSIQVLSTYPIRVLPVPCSLVVLPTLPAAVSHVPRVPIPWCYQRRLPQSSADRVFAPSSGGESRAGTARRELRLGCELLFRRRVGAAARRALDDFRPDIVHALRIPFEAILVAPVMRRRPEPFLISTWGNDLTLYAAQSTTHRYLTRQVLHQADGLHCDCERDLGLARRLGYRGSSLIAPGSGGIDVGTFPNASNAQRARQRLDAPEDAPIIFNPRSYRDYVRNDVFFAALPAVMRRFPTAIAVTVGMDGNNDYRRYASNLGIGNAVRFLPAQDRAGMADLFSAATVTVSPSTHDGTPNTVLEAMACGSFPIVGDIQSLREWIEPGINGLVVDSNSVAAVSEAINAALADADLRRRAAARNRAIIEERATRGAVRPALEQFYARANRPPTRRHDR